MLEKYLSIVALVFIRYWIVAYGYYLISWKLLSHKIKKFRVNLNQPFEGQLRYEVIFSLITTLIFAVGGTFFIAAKQNQWGLIYHDFNDFGLPYWIFSVIAMLLINDVYFYWTHRWLHSSFLFFKVHYVHHKSRVTTPMTSQSFHFFESLVNVFVVLLFPFILPIHPSAYITFTFIAFLNNVYGHGNYDFVVDRWKDRFPFKYLNSPSVHGYHHAKINGNFGLYTNVWDRLHGTFVNPKKST
jgi:lathosterol oxidase